MLNELEKNWFVKVYFFYQFNFFNFVKTARLCNSINLCWYRLHWKIITRKLFKKFQVLASLNKLNEKLLIFYSLQKSQRSKVQECFENRKKKYDGILYHCQQSQKIFFIFQYLAQRYKTLVLLNKLFFWQSAFNINLKYHHWFN